MAAALGIPLSAHEECVFDAGERMLRPLDSVRGRSVYVVQSLFSDALGSANDRLCALLFFIGALKDAGAARVTACVPYLAYARQDRHTEARDPVTTRYVAQLFEAVRVDRVVALEVHNPAAFDNAFRCAGQRAALGVDLGELIAGDKKDIVLTNRLRSHLDRVAIYGWHASNGRPIQPLSTVHGWRYADYSHGARLVSTDIFVNGRPRSIFSALQDSRLARALSDEGVMADVVGLIETLDQRTQAVIAAIR